MNLEDYQKAECSLFRIPPLDFSQADRAIEEILVDAWKRGSSADGAVRNILVDSEIIDGLAYQISKSIAFQKKAEMERLEGEVQERMRTYEEAKKAESERVRMVYEQKAQSRKSEVDSAGETYDKSARAYSAAQTNLNQMRERVQRELGGVGGIEGAETLLAINEALKTPVPSTFSKRYASTAPPEKKKAGEESIDDVLRYVETGKGPAGSEDALAVPGKPAYHRGGIYGFFSRIFRIFNYKTWSRKNG